MMPHPPQFELLFVVLISQPLLYVRSQFANPALHVT